MLSSGYSPTSSDNPLPLTPTESRTPEVDIIIVTSPSELEAAQSPNATAKPLTINGRSFGAFVDVQSLQIEAMTARLSPDYEHLLVEETCVELYEKQEVLDLDTGVINFKQNPENLKQNPENDLGQDTEQRPIKPKAKLKMRGDCPRPGCYERQEQRSGYCILHTCLAMNADQTRCPNKVLNPLSSRYCRSGYHKENGRLKELEELIARRIDFDAEEARAREASIVASMLWTKQNCPSLPPIYPHLWVPGYDNTKPDPPSNGANPYGPLSRQRFFDADRYLNGTWRLPPKPSVGRE